MGHESRATKSGEVEGEAPKERSAGTWGSRGRAAFSGCLKAGRKPGGRVKDSWGFKLLGGGEAGGWGERGQ